MFYHTILPCWFLDYHRRYIILSPWELFQEGDAADIYSIIDTCNDCLFAAVLLASRSHQTRESPSSAKAFDWVMRCSWKGASALELFNGMWHLPLGTTVTVGDNEPGTDIGTNRLHQISVQWNCWSRDIAGLWKTVLNFEMALSSR